MVLTHQQELRKQLSTSLQAAGHSVAIPTHRADMVTVLHSSKPGLIVLDLYMNHPSGVEDLKILRDEGYQGRVIVLSGPSMRSLLKDIYPSEIESVVQIPANVHGQYQLGNLQSAISSSQHADISRRAYALYELGGRQDGHDLQDWLQAERDTV
jgi:CheY-like chemotaxis protein